MKVITASTIGNLISAHIEGKGEKIMDQNTKVVVSAAIIVDCIFRIF